MAILEKDGQVTYFAGGDSYFSHAAGDEAGRRFALARLMENGHVKAAELERAPLRNPHRTLMSWVGQSRKAGPSSFFRPAAPSRPRIMTPDKSAECARLLSEGKRPSAVARQVGVKESTLRKAIRRQAVPQLAPLSEERVESDPASTKSERSRADAEAAAGMGTACTRADERIQAALGLAIGATTRFEASQDVAMGGLLAGLPALCANGLLTGLGRHLKLPRGFYSALHILLLLGFMALGRIKRPEHLRQTPPGELGKVIGLDRALFARLMTGRWVGEHQNVLLCGPTGIGKTFLACALANQACRQGHSVLYVHLTRLLPTLAIGRGDGSYFKSLAQITKTEVLVIDEWALAPLTDESRRDLLEIFDDRHGSRSTIITSQLPVKHWHAAIGDPTLADAILDRLVHQAHVLDLDGESLRKNGKPE